jgi:hypothetical protein
MTSDISVVTGEDGGTNLEGSWVAMGEVESMEHLWSS